MIARREGRHSYLGTFERHFPTCIAYHHAIKLVLHNTRVGAANYCTVKSMLSVADSPPLEA